jgi:hypothetical protein
VVGVTEQMAGVGVAAVEDPRERLRGDLVAVEQAE